MNRRKLMILALGSTTTIGVIMAGFGFEEAAEKLGVERRVLTAGENKAVMDPFSPISPEDRKHMQVMLDEIHQQFITAVKNGRGDRLKADTHPEIFSGLFWTGEKAMELGLVDGLTFFSCLASFGARRSFAFLSRRHQSHFRLNASIAGFRVGGCAAPTPGFRSIGLID